MAAFLPLLATMAMRAATSLQSPALTSSRADRFYHPPPWSMSMIDQRATKKLRAWPAPLSRFSHPSRYGSLCTETATSSFHGRSLIASNGQESQQMQQSAVLIRLVFRQEPPADRSGSLEAMIVACREGQCLWVSCVEL
ncbi:hypothetical protein F4677DRAFT_447527 [Hypoxylon crocopeplum]|nr:hypothetical protein F4677DRAFT_447527 [Hypoxylon crocopeplum]